jgi:hypothetical protein
MSAGASQAAHTDHEVVVGVDGSEQATTAVRWATREAARRGTALRLVHAWVWPLYRISLDAPPGAPPGAGLRAVAEQVLADGARTACETEPRVSARCGSRAALHGFCVHRKALGARERGTGGREATGRLGRQGYARHAPPEGRG